LRLAKAASSRPQLNYI